MEKQQQIRPTFDSLTALVVESVDNMRTTIVTILVDAGFKQVLSAGTGSDALNILQKHDVDVVLSEWQLPKLNGIELLRNVRQDPKLAQIPFIMTSATIEQSEVIRAIRNGVSEYVVKPFSAKILIERVQRAITNPVKQNNAPHQRSHTNTTHKTDKLNVLVVDDEAANIQLLSDLLKDKYAIKAAKDGKLALDICLSEHQPDIILLDIMMPNMDGLEVCKRLKASPKTQHIAIIFLTAMNTTDDVVKGLNLGALDYITKPITPTIVKARVDTHAKVVMANKALHQQLDSMVEMARLKDEFDRIVKNDLKQPLNEIFKSLDQLEFHPRDLNRVRELARTIRTSSTNLSMMIEGMLAVSQIEDGSYQLNPINFRLRPVLDKIVENFAATISNKRLEINVEYHCGDNIIGEEQLTLSALSNLFQNAVEAAPRGSAVNIDIEHEDKFTKISMSNQGSVPEEIMGTFFDKYVSSGKKNSTGIGTYASKLMTEIQNGKIAFSSSESLGTQLLVYLPH